MEPLPGKIFLTKCTESNNKNKKDIRSTRLRSGVETYPPIRELYECRYLYRHKHDIRISIKVKCIFWYSFYLQSVEYSYRG